MLSLFLGPLALSLLTAAPSVDFYPGRWRFHGGEHDAIPKVVMTALMAAYLRDPKDATTAAHVGFLHAWRVSESARLSQPSPSIVDEANAERRLSPAIRPPLRSQSVTSSGR